MKAVVKRAYRAYLELVLKTSTVSFENFYEIDDEIMDNCILGFWHGDSYSMNLLLKKLNKYYKVKKHKDIDVNVVVTADERGEYIEYMLNSYGAHALRMPDGVKMKSFLKELRDKSREESVVVLALDGPIGPLHEPKKIAFSLAKDSEKPFVGIKVEHSKKIRLTKRWDNYGIPLPFTNIKFSADVFGKIDKEVLTNFKEYKEEVKERLCS
ncbi:hypothetical protein [Clostridium sp. B9]|uniref:hypothetical protein n=1 Tax=Clostridium sp. B9 TaxID=3423224 RepID=UPI003D2EC5CE